MTAKKVDHKNGIKIWIADPNVADAIKEITTAIVALQEAQVDVPINSDEYWSNIWRIDDLSLVYADLLINGVGEATIAVIDARIGLIQEYADMSDEIIWDRIEDLNYIRDCLTSEFWL